MKKSEGLKYIVSLIIAGIIGYMVYYLSTPAINIRDLDWLLVIAVFLISFNLSMFISGVNEGKKQKVMGIIVIIFIGMVVLLSLSALKNARIFKAKEYSKRVEVQTGEFAKEVEEVDFNRIPSIDSDTASRLGARKMGAMIDLVSQFEPSTEYTQIDYKGKAVRVSPLKYAGVMKWLNNKADGIPAYIRVDMSTGETELVKLQEPIKYSISDRFGRDINRHVQRGNKKELLNRAVFEIDEEGKPYWVSAIYEYKIGWVSGKDIVGAVITDAATGEMKRYELKDIPQWVDRVYDANLIIQQVDDYGSLKSGFWNSKIGQKGVMRTTEGYNYLSIGTDIYLYTNTLILQLKHM